MTTVYFKGSLQTSSLTYKEICRVSAKLTIDPKRIFFEINEENGDATLYIERHNNCLAHGLTFSL